MAKVRTSVGEWSGIASTNIGEPPPPPKPSAALTAALLDRAAREDADRLFRESSCLAAEVHIPEDHWPPAGCLVQHCTVPGCGICARLRSEVWDYEE